LGQQVLNTKLAALRVAMIDETLRQTGDPLYVITGNLADTIMRVLEEWMESLRLQTPPNG
jgi:hypothetical protein